MTTVHYPDGEVVVYESYEDFFNDRRARNERLSPDRYITIMDFCQSATGDIVLSTAIVCSPVPPPRDDPEPDHVTGTQ